MSETSEEKNLSKYNELVRKIEQPPGARYAAKGVIPYLCRYLKGAGLSNEDIRDKVRKDLTKYGSVGSNGYSRSTINETIPVEFKDHERVTRGKRAAEKVRNRKLLYNNIV